MVNQKLTNFSLKKVEEADFKNYPYIEENTNRRYGSFDLLKKVKVRQDILMVNY